MLSSLRKIIRESIEREFLCEINIEMDDVKNRGFADQLGQMYKKSLAILKPTKIYGKLGIKSAHSDADASFFKITLKNGDYIKAVRNTNPAFGTISINDGDAQMIYSKELFSNKFPDLIKKYYLSYKTANAGIPSM